ncbi:hypothetical protein L3X38_042373 [Prunus dulcis]|uniref:Uncharacterized protein n=1 Tax=Prunus dulcis TaxID=3755 RepID=A0AAD4UUT5_PRUDU|nr:hypothetical protein L3X38_042373 [Prunus dulcis]
MNQFSRILEAVRRTSMSVKLVSGQRNEEDDDHQALSEDDKSSNDVNPHRRRDRKSYPLLPCKDEESHVILDAMFTNKCEEGSSSGVFTIDMPEEHHLGA